MKRRDIIKGGLAGITAASVAAPAIAQATTEFSIVTDHPDDATALSERLKVVSNGRMTLRVDAKETSAASGFLQAVSDGNTDMYLTREEAFRGTNPAFMFFTSFPGGMSSSELEGWMLTSDGTALRDFLGSDYGIKSFMASDHGTQPIWSKTAIGGLGDLSNLTAASFGASQDVMKKIGLNKVDDLQQNIASAASYDLIEGFTTSQMVKLGLHKSHPYMISPNAGRPSSAIGLGVNASKFSALSDADQLLLRLAIDAHHGIGRIKVNHDDAMALRAEASTIKPTTMPDDIWNAQLNAGIELMKELDETSIMASDIGYSYQLFLGDVENWSEIGEAAFFLGRKSAFSR